MILYSKRRADHRSRLMAKQTIRLFRTNTMPLVGNFGRSKMTANVSDIHHNNGSTDTLAPQPSKAVSTWIGRRLDETGKVVISTNLPGAVHRL